uniref:Uncharacterized protein n=1 Tax=Glossina brevipalpis TaxID=37001 RepID=A0A1A9W488_9MUSC
MKECRPNNNFENGSRETESTNRHESSTATPSSYSESNLDAKLKSKHICSDLPQLKIARKSHEVTNEDLKPGEASVLNVFDNSLETFNMRKSLDSNYLTMNRDKQNRDDELEKITAMEKKENLCCKCSISTGPRTLTCYNMFNYLHEEKSIVIRFLMSTILVLAYGSIFFKNSLRKILPSIELNRNFKTVIPQNE